MKGREGLSSPILSPKLPVKPLKRRRMRLGTTDSELNDSTLDLLDALRDVPSKGTKGSSRKPLPAIGSLENNFETGSNLNNSIGFKPKQRPGLNKNDLTLNSEIAIEQSRMDNSKMTLRPRRRREPSFLVNNDNTDNFEEKINSKSDLKLDFPTDFIDNISVYSDLSEDFSKKNREPRRRGKKSDNNINFDEQKPYSTRAKAGRRSYRARDTPPQLIVDKNDEANRLKFGTTLDVPDSSLNLRNKVVEDEMLLRLKDDSPSRIERNSISSDRSKNSEVFEKRRSRRSRHVDDNSSNIGVIGDNGFSDAASVFSDDFTDTYDPTFSSNPTKNRNRDTFPSVLSTEEDLKASQSGILTLPQRHKKRSRRQTTEASNVTAENPLFSNDVNFLSSNSFYDSSEQSHQLYTKQHRRIPRKYLPPLSETLNNPK